MEKIDEPKSETEAPRGSTTLHRVGFVITGVWMLGLVGYAALNYPVLIRLAPNEIGDFAAGAFAPLAFLWLVLGFFQQGEELRYSGRALWLQGEELRRSVEQQRELVNVTREQFALEGSMARPILKARANYFDRGSGSDDHDLVEFYVQNHGELCTDLQFDCDYLENRSPRNALERGGTAGVSFKKPRGDEGPIEVVVTYKDLRGVPGKEAFSISVEGDDLMVFEQDSATSPRSLP